VLPRLTPINARWSLPFAALVLVSSYYMLWVRAALLVGYKGLNMLLEVKDGSKPPSAQKLTPQQEIWHRDWRGHAVVVNSPEAALAAIGVIVTIGSIE
jgi:hypothetical protein